jgi:hypothetical protein
MSNERKPIGEVLAGLSIHPLLEGEKPVEAFLLVKVKPKKGPVTWSYRTTRPPNREELLGALLVHVEILRRELVEEWESE